MKLTRYYKISIERLAYLNINFITFAHLLAFLMEKGLINRLKNGDRHAFDVLYYMYVRQLTAYCHAYVANLEDVEEIVEDVFISLWTCRANIRNTESLRPLLFTSLRNKTIDYYKSRLNAPLYEDYVNINDELSHSDDFSPMEYDEFEQTVMREIATLPHSQREVVMLSKIEGLTHAEIVARLNLSLQTVKNLLSMGLKQLRIQLMRYHKINFIFILYFFTSTI